MTYFLKKCQAKKGNSKKIRQRNLYKTQFPPLYPEKYHHRKKLPIALAVDVKHLSYLERDTS